MEHRKSNRNRNITLTILILIGAGIASLWLAWANGAFGVTNHRYYPFGFNNDETVWAGLMAQGADVALQYFPGGYSAYPIQQKSGPYLGKRIISSFEIYHPDVRSDEAWPLKSEFDIIYHFEWKTPAGVSLYSEIN